MREIKRQRLPAIPLRYGRVVVSICLVSLVALVVCRYHRVIIHGGYRGTAALGTGAHDNMDLSHPETPFVAWPLARVCRETTWTPGVVFKCDNNSGGIGNIRNYILTCLRYGIAAGATGLLMPKIQTRSEANLADLFKGHQPFGYFFNEQHFRDGLSAACPQITIYDDVADIPNLQEPFISEDITPNHFGMRGGCDKRELNKHTDAFGVRFRASLAESAEKWKVPPVSAAQPRVFRMTWGVQWDFPVYKDGPEFVATYGGLLKFREDILELGKKAVGLVRRQARSAGRTDDFIGLHLRTENDALSPWPNYEAQSRAYIDRATIMGATAAYLATGNETEAGRLKAKARLESNMLVMTKHDLLRNTPDGLSELNSLSWDQQGLVDFVVLLEATYFMGVSPSSFSINIAGKRHLQMEGLYTRPWKIGGDGDGRSWLIGNYEQYWDDWLFMYDSLWP